MKRLFSRLLTILGALTLLIMVLFFIANIVMVARTPEVPDKTVLELPFDEEIVEYVPEESMALAVLDDSPRLIDLVAALERAAGDDRVKAIVANVSGIYMGLAKIQEIRDAVFAFRKSGKKAYAYADTLGEFGPGTKSYYLATAFDKIFVQPSGSVCITGFMAETPFVRGTLDKIGVSPRFDSRSEYKNAMNMFTETQYTEPHEEAIRALFTSFYDKMAVDVSAARGIEEQTVRELFDRGLFSAAEAVEEGLIDRTMYRDEVFDLVEKEAGADAERLSWSGYLKRAGTPYSDGKTIALIYGVGAVQRGKSGMSPMSGEAAMGSETVSAAIRQAVRDESVEAIVFRIDSPGGSYVASDTIWRATVEARERGVPIIASMGDVAGSGGYFIAMDADKIVAQPCTLTGSIGVFAGKMITSEFWSKLGVTWDDFKTSENASFWSGIHDYTPEQWDLFQHWLDRIYEDFTKKAAEGRNIPPERLLELAKGRVWSGRDACDLGLVDALGGYNEAIRLAKEAAGIPQDENVILKEFPTPKSFLEKLANSIPVMARRSEGSEAAARALEAAGPYLKMLSRFGLGDEAGALSMPPWTGSFR